MAYEKKLDAKLTAAIVATGVMSFCGVLVETAMNIAFPTIMEEFGVTSSTVQWITTGYLLMLAIIVPTSAYLNRRFRMRTLFIAAVALFITGSLIGALAVNFPMLLAGRLIQGAGTGIASPLMFNIVYEQVPDESLGTMSGVASFTTSIAPAIGPSVGGALVTAFGWRSIFWVLLPIIGVAAVVGIASIRESHELGHPSFDVAGELLVALFAAALLLGVSSTDAGALTVLAFLGISAASFALYVRHARAVENPLIDLAVFHVPAFSFAVAALVLGQMVQLGINYLLPNYLQVSLGATAALAGNLLIPGCLLMALTVPVSGIVYDRWGATVPVLAGAVGIVLGCLGFSLFGTMGSYLVLVAFHVLTAMSVAASNVNVRTHGMKQLGRALESDGNAAINTVQQLAGGLGTAVCSSIVAAAQAGAADVAAATASGTGIAFLVMLACGIGVLVADVAALRLGQVRELGRVGDRAVGVRA